MKFLRGSATTSGFAGSIVLSSVWTDGPEVVSSLVIAIGRLGNHLGILVMKIRRRLTRGRKETSRLWSLGDIWIIVRLAKAEKLSSEVPLEIEKLEDGITSGKEALCLG